MTYTTNAELVEVPDRLWAQKLKDNDFGSEKVDAFYDGDMNGVFAPSAIIHEARAGNKRIITLFVHEIGHAMKFPGNDHPYDVLGVIRHARKVGFDDRAYSGYLRWRKNKELRAAALPWLVKNGMA